MHKLITIYGGSGFVGRYVARNMAARGWRIRVAVRRPNQALFVRPYGDPGQVEPVLCNIRDDASVRAAMLGASVVVNCVGTFDRGGKNSFRAVQTEGAGRIARIAAEEGVGRLVHVSAISANVEGNSLYAQSKGEGEKAVLAAFPDAVIMRPSVIFGNEDGFFNKFANMAQYTPILMVPYGNTRIQPVYVEDVAEAVSRAAEGAAAPGVHELGGPEIDTLRGLVRRMLPVIWRQRAVWSVPAPVLWVPAFLLDMVAAATRGLISNRLITRDQIRMLATDNVVRDGVPGLRELGITPTAMEAVLPEYLWRFRPAGEFAAIKASARNLKGI